MKIDKSKYHVLLRRVVVCFMMLFSWSCFAYDWWEDVPLLWIDGIGYCVCDYYEDGVKIYEGAEVATHAGVTNLILPNFVTDEFGSSHKVWGIEREAFFGCQTLKTITGLDRCYRVGSLAFGNTGLEEVVIPAGVVFDTYAFNDCEKLKKVSFSAGVTAVPAYIFPGCGILTDISFPDGLTEIGEYSFWCCESLRNLELPSGLIRIDSGAFSGCDLLNDVVLPDSVEEIESFAFSQDPRLQRIDFSRNLKHIGKESFSQSGLTNLNLSSTVTERIGNAAFLYCTNLIDVSFPVTLKSIDDSAFVRTAITNLDLSGTEIETLGDCVFNGCTDLRGAIVMPESLQAVGAMSFTVSPLTVLFDGPPPDTGDGAFCVLEDFTTWYRVDNHGMFDGEYAKEWKSAIKDWDDEHGTTNEWHGIKFDLIIEPISYELKSGDQLLNLSWHLPTNKYYSLENALVDLPKRNLLFSLWRSGDDPNSFNDFKKAECIAVDITATNYVDDTFGEIRGTHPVCYWLEIQDEKLACDPAGRHPSDVVGFPAKCITRRRFGLAIGLADYVAEMREDRASGFVADTRKFIDLVESSYDGCKVDGLNDSCATIENISKGIRALPLDDNGNRRIVPGDMVYLWIASHGGTNCANGGAGIAAYDGYYGNSSSTNVMTGRCVPQSLREDLSWVEENPGVRVICVFPFCHSRAVWQGFDAFENCAFVGATRIDESSLIYSSETQFGRFFLNFGISKGLANLSQISGRPQPCDNFDSQCFDIPDHICNGQSGIDVTLDELALYTKSLAFGASSRMPARVVIERTNLLASINMACDCPVQNGEVPKLPKLTVAEQASGILYLKYTLPDDWQEVIFWFREEKDPSEWHWFTLSSTWNDRVKYDATNKGCRFVPFGTQTLEERMFRGVIKPDTGYIFAVQCVNEFGYGDTILVNKVHKTGADLPLVARDVFIKEFGKMYKYLGELKEWGISVSISVTPEGDFWTIGMSLDEDGNPVEYIGRARSEDITEGGVMKANVSRKKTSTAVKRLTSSTRECELPDCFDLDISLNGVVGTGEDIEICCRPVCDIDEAVDPIPQLGADASPGEIAEALAGSSDEKLTANITDAAGYSAYRSWAETVRKSDGSEVAGAQAVKDAPNAWLSFALGSQTLIDLLPTNGQMKIDQFEPAATAGAFDFTVSIDNISVGSEAARENLKKVFGLEGGQSLTDLSPTNVDISFGTPENGKVKFTAGPNAKNVGAKTFFMKVKMTP